MSHESHGRPHEKSQDRHVAQHLAQILKELQRIAAHVRTLEEKMNDLLDALTEKVRVISDRTDAIVALVKGLREESRKAGNDPVKRKALEDAMDAAAQKLADAAVEGTEPPTTDPNFNPNA